MSVVVLRLASPLQSWSGYRLALNKDSASPSQPVPRKSAVNGIIGAALGSRELDVIGEKYDLHIRVERTNPVAEDFQVIGPLPGYVAPGSRGRATELAERHEKIATATATAKFPKVRNGGNFLTAISRKDYLSHSEFLVALDTRGRADLADQWLAALREPVFMPYLGRKSCPPSFPYVLGRWNGSVDDLWALTPHVRSHEQRRDADGNVSLRAYLIGGDYDSHSDVKTVVSAPVVADRAEQLEWAKEHLR